MVTSASNVCTVSWSDLPVPPDDTQVLQVDNDGGIFRVRVERGQIRRGR